MKKKLGVWDQVLTVVVIMYKNKIPLTNCGYFIGVCNNVFYMHSLTFICLPYIILPYVGLLNLITPSKRQ